MRGPVILLHGIARTRRSMAGLAGFLEKHGYRAHNLGYPSTRESLEALEERVHSQIAPLFIGAEPVHFVGYSMGGLLIRALLTRHRPARMGRVVMLAPPNQGSEVADFLKDWPLYRWIYGPAGQQLITDQNEFSHLFGPVDYELGILAGNRFIDPLCALLLPGAHDGKVSVERTRLAGMADHRVIPASHTFFPSNRTAWRQTLHFLEHGRFAPPIHSHPLTFGPLSI